MKGHRVAPIYYYAEYTDMKHRDTHLHHGYDLIKRIGTEPNSTHNPRLRLIVI